MRKTVSNTWVSDLLNTVGDVPPYMRRQFLIYLARAAAFVHLPRNFAVRLIHQLGFYEQDLPILIHEAYSGDFGRHWWRNFVQDELHERVVGILAKISAELPEKPDWLVISSIITKTGEERIQRVKLDYLALAKELAQDLHLHVGLKNGDIAVLLAYNPQEGTYTRDGEGILVRALYEKLRLAEEYLRAHYADDRELVKKKVVEEVKTALITFGEPVERVLARFDDYSRYLPVANGILDLQTGKLHDFSPDFRFTFKIPTPYDPNADIQLIEDYLRGLVAPEDLENLKRALGYIFVPGQPWKKMFLLYGPPNSGKSTLLELIKQTIGPENVATENLHDLTSKSFNVFNLVGKLVNLSSEQPDLRKGADVQRIKAITGGDAITVERKFKQPFSAVINAKLFFAGNAIPRLPEDDEALWKRVVLVKFPHSFPDSPKEGRRIVETLRVPLLRAMVEWRNIVAEEGFVVSASLEDLKKKAIYTHDPVRAFVISQIREDPDSRISVVDLYKTFCEWAEREGIPQGTADVVLTPEFVETILNEKGPTGLRRKLIVFSKALRRALDDQMINYDIQRPREGDSRPTVIVGISVGPPTSESPQLVESIDISEGHSATAEKVRLLLNVIRDLNRKYDAVDTLELQKEAVEYGLSEQETVSILDRLKKDGLIYEPKPGLIRLSEGVVA